MKTKGKLLAFFAHFSVTFALQTGGWKLAISQNQTEILRTSFPPKNTPEKHIFQFDSKLIPSTLS